MKVVIVLPTYNERENIITLLDALHRVTKSIKGHSFSFLVVDDTSPDGTQDIVEEYRKTHKSVHIITGAKEGLGKALLRGMKYAIETLHGEILVQMDADLSHDPKALIRFFSAIDTGSDFVVGSRYIPGGSIPSNWGMHRKIFSVVGNEFVRFGLGFPKIHDWTGGFRAYHKKYIQAVQQEMGKYSGYVFQIAFLHKSIKRGAVIFEVPIHFTDRLYGRSKIAPLEYIKNVFLYVFTSRLEEVLHGSFGKFLVVGTIGFIINTIGLEVLVSMGAHPAIGSIIGAEMAIISNFMLNNAWTFKDRTIAKGGAWKKFLQFNTTSLGAILIQGLSVGIGTSLFGVDLYRVFYIVGVGIGLVWNYTMYSRVIWKKTP